MRYKIGDIVKILDESKFGSWAGQRVIITNINNDGFRQYDVKKENSPLATGSIEEGWCKPTSQRIFLFEDE